MDHVSLVTSRERDGRVLRLVPPADTFTARHVDELVVACSEASSDRSVDLVFLDGRSGLLSVVDASVLARSGVSPASSLAGVRQPVVAVIGKQCSSLGLELLLACDIRVAADDAVLHLPDLAAGELFRWGGIQRLIRSVPPAVATALVLLGGQLSMREAIELGVLHGERDVDDVLDRLLSLAPLALELTKEAVRRGAELPLSAGLRLEGDLNTLLQHTDDRAEGLRAFFEKRQPQFHGR